MMKFITLLLAIFLSISPVLAKQKVALVIGNANYPGQTYNNLFTPLKNPVNDAEDMKAVLEDYDFEVILLKDGEMENMEDAIDEFEKRLENSEVGLFYFAGHGVQIEGTNYLIPVGKKFRSAKPVKGGHAIDANDVLGMMEEAGTQVNIVILDACRTKMSIKSRGIAKRGLAEMNAKGSMIVYATAPGKEASDGEGDERNGIYTKHLVATMKNGNGLPIYEVFNQTGAAVEKATNSKQTPWYNSSFHGEFCLGPCRRPTTPTRSNEILALGKYFITQIEEALKQDRQDQAEKYLVMLRAANPGSLKLAELEARLVDSDGDGFIDELDKCPNNTISEKAKGVYKSGSKKGCPLDSDKDGVADYQDSCPRNTSTEISKKVNSRGCPLDLDKDGIADYQDLCPRNISKSERTKDIYKSGSKKGCPIDPDIRYYDNNDGTVTDTRSGLIWLKNANCFGWIIWDTARQSAAKLAHGQCGLSDGSRAGMWRLPTRKEWKAMIDDKYRPAISNATGTGPWKEGDAFSDVVSMDYWSSNAYTGSYWRAWGVNLNSGKFYTYNNRDFGYYGDGLRVWPVRSR